MDASAVANSVNGSGELRPVFIGRDGQRLFGILHLPEQRRTDVGIVFCSSGLQNRAGPHRMYVKAARHFSRLGIVSLRVDLPGVGDSDMRELEQNFDSHDPASVAGATNFLVETQGVKRLILLGLCAGARVAIKAAARDPRAVGVVAWGLPIISGPVNMKVSKGGGAYMGKARARSQLREWAPKLVSPVAWYRYLTSEKTVGEGTRMVGRALSGLLPERLRPKSSNQSDFFRSIDAFIASGRPMLFMYGDDDKIGRQEFGERFPDIAASRSATCDLMVVPNGDHTFTRPSATDEAIERTGDWLLRRLVGS
jgi:pimeloyl-ACP methyl ester carboxylesterase